MPAALTILLIDDDPGARALATVAIRKALPFVEIDTSVVDDLTFRAVLERDAFHAVVTDYRLQWSDGLHVLGAMRAKYPDVPVVLFTGSGSEEIAVKAFQAGFDDYVVNKPGDVVRLPAAIRRAVARRRAERDRRAAEDELRSVKQSLEEANRLKDDFLAVVSHELRTPLNAILGWASLIAMGRVGSAELKRAGEIIQRNARMQAQLIDDLLDISRIVSGKLRLDVVDVDLVAVIEAAVETVRASAEAKRIEVRTLLDADASCVAGDPGRLQQIVWNLLTNAVKFTPDGGRVDVRLARVDGSVKLSVTDDGIGIDGDFLPHVFDRFRQGRASTTRGAGGLGVGLTIVRHLTELHGGTVAVRSDGDGRGAEFMVTLPSRMPHAFGDGSSANGGAAEGFDVRLEGVRVLVVDDDEDARVLMRRVLEEAGAEVATAESVEECVALLAGVSPHVLLSDVGMPEEDGLSLIRRIRGMERERGLPHLPAVALTAFTRDEDRKQAVAAGFQLHLSKPIDPFELITLVRDLARIPASEIV